QAEDGIRDDLVTGVQTCALPIYSISQGWRPGLSNTAPLGQNPLPTSILLPAGKVRFGSARTLHEGKLLVVLGGDLCGRKRLAIRSEERRVGKEGSGKVEGGRERR